MLGVGSGNDAGTMSPESKKYKAFISYSHPDEGWAKWLQHALERYRVPGRLRRERPDLPRRLHPVFRDREELASSGDLSDSIHTAMADAEALIVICSPTAARSKWVNEEIKLFRRLGGAKRIFCLLVDGTPDGHPETGAFPEALLRDEQGQPLPEPLAADVTDGGDGKRGALIKMAAGLLGVGIDDLRQRDQQRQVRFWASVAVGAMAISVITIGLAIFAYLAREESELRRTQAENLIGFMLGDLRERLEPVGRLDVLDAVGDEAMDYFAALGDRGSEDEVMARAMALRQIGEVRFSQGQLEPALEAFTESRDVARALHEANPSDNDILFELGQAEFWVGYVAWERNDLDGADEAFQKYKDVSVELAERDPADPDFRLELMYSWSNLGSVARERGDSEDALQSFQRVVAINESMLAENAEDADLHYELAESLSWLGSAQRDNYRLHEASDTFGRAQALLEEISEGGADPEHADALGDVSSLRAGIFHHLGEIEEARANWRRSVSVFSALVDRDQDNAQWREGLANAHGRLGASMLSIDDIEAAVHHLTVALEGLEILVREDPSNLVFQQRLSWTRAKLALAEAYRSADGAAERVGAARSASDAAMALGSAGIKQLELAVSVRLIEGDVLLLLDQPAAAETAWSDALELLTTSPQGTPYLDAQQAYLMARLGREQEARALSQRLEAVGFNDPEVGVHD